MLWPSRLSSCMPPSIMVPGVAVVGSCLGRTLGSCNTQIESRPVSVHMHQSQSNVIIYYYYYYYTKKCFCHHKQPSPEKQQLACSHTGAMTAVVNNQSNSCHVIVTTLTAMTGGLPAWQKSQLVVISTGSSRQADLIISHSVSRLIRPHDNKDEVKRGQLLLTLKSNHHTLFIS